MRLFAVLVLLLSALLAIAGKSWAAEPVASVPYRVDYTGWFTIEVSVNGEGPYDFIIDTGATQSLVFQNLADEMTFPPTGGPDQTVLGLAAAGAFPPYFIGELEVGAARFDKLISVILPDWPVEDRPQGVIGLDFLRNYVVVFDAEAGLIHFYSPDDPPTTIERWKRVKMEADNFGLEINYLYTMEGRLNSRRVRFLLDLGASGTLVNRAAVASVIKSGIAITVRPSGGDARLRITDALQKSETAQAVTIQRFQLGRTYWYRHRFGIQNAPIFTELGVQNKPFGLFGADLIRDYSFALDFGNERFWLGPKGRAPRAIENES